MHMNQPASPAARRPRRPETSGLKVFVTQDAPLALGDAEESSEMNGSDYGRACERIRQENARLLDDFASMLRKQRLAPSTIRRHRDNADFFLNEFLLYEEAQTAVDGITEIDRFLGDWFIRKAMWSTPRAIKSNATSLFKFYAFLAALDKITPTQLAELRLTINRRLPEWQAACERYNNPDLDD